MKLWQGNVFSHVCLSYRLFVGGGVATGPCTPTVQPPPRHIHYETQPVGKRAVGIRLTCLLMVTVDLDELYKKTLDDLSVI